MFEEIIKKTVDDLDEKFNDRVSSLEGKIDEIKTDIAEIKTMIGRL